MSQTIVNAFVKSLAGVGSVRLPYQCDFVYLDTVTGAVQVSIGGGDFFTAKAGFKFKANPGQIFPRVELKGTGSVIVLYGTGDLQTGGAAGGGSSVKQIYTGAWADPNGNVTPDDPTLAAIYYDDVPEPTQWTWSVAGQNWI